MKRISCASRWRTLVFAGLLAGLCHHPAFSQDVFPSRPIRVVVPFTAGGTSDVLARLVAQRLATLYGQQVVVDNRPGAGGHIGADLVAKAPPDGYTLVVGTVGIHAAYAIYKTLPYDPAKDLVPVSVMADLPCVLIVHPSFPAKTLGEFIAYAKANPGKVNFGSAGSGSSTHMTGELFKLVAGVQLTHVPYRGSAPALNDVIAGQIQSMFENLPTLPGQIKAGTIRGLVITSKARSAAVPDVPTPAEAGLPDYESTAWFTIAAPAGLPKPILEKLNADINGQLALPEVIGKIRELGASPVGGTPEQIDAFFAAERIKWNKVITTAGITGE